MSLFRKKKCKQEHFILSVEKVFKNSKIVMLRIDIFPNHTAVIELMNNDGELYKISAHDVRMIG